MNVFWFRRDLRLEDNAALFFALSENEKVLPIFIFDRNILSELPTDDARVSFIYQLLEKINSALKKYNSTLAVFHGEPKDVFANLIREQPITAVFANHDFEPYARKRDTEISKL
jgi:deoxyribodipyrimidine photo-lyase